MARYKFSWKRLIKRIISFLFWTVLRLITRNGFRILKGVHYFINSFGNMTPDVLEAGRILSPTPQFRKTNHQRGERRPNSSFKKFNKRPGDRDFDVRARRERRLHYRESLF